MDENIKREAERAHDRSYEFELKINEAAINNGNIALRTALLINGGAAIAVMTFLGNLYSNEKTASGRDFGPLISSIEWFGWGVALAGLAIALAYFTNTYIAASANETNKTWQHPFVVPNDKSKRYACLADGCRIAAVVSGCSSLFLFVVGVHRIAGAAIGLL
jgi:hypothetical protein